MKCFVINLDRSPERYRWFLESTAKLNLDIIRVVAVDGSRLPAGEIARLQSLRSGFFDVAKGEIGCFLSHRNVWQLVSDGDDEWGFVAEDDIHFDRVPWRGVAYYIHGVSGFWPEGISVCRSGQADDGIIAHCGDSLKGHVA